jgi:hypothetical protein
MAEYVERWFQTIKYVEAPTSTLADPHFDSFLVHLPWTTSHDGDVSRRKLLYAIELVAYMLHLDPESPETCFSIAYGLKVTIRHGMILSSSCPR